MTAGDVDRLQPRRTADDLAGMTAGPLEQDVGDGADARCQESRLPGGDARLQAVEAFGLDRLRHLIGGVGGGRAGARRCT